MSGDFRKFVVPVDFSAGAARASRYAAGLAQTLGARLYLIHVLDQRGFTGRLAEPEDELYESARARLAELAATLPTGSAITTEVRCGRVGACIANATVDYGGDLIVMSAHGRTGLSHLLMGSVAESVIRKAPCPVLVVRGSGQVHVRRPAA